MKNITITYNFSSTSVEPPSGANFLPSPLASSRFTPVPGVGATRLSSVPFGLAFPRSGPPVPVAKLSRGALGVFVASSRRRFVAFPALDSPVVTSLDPFPSAVAINALPASGAWLPSGQFGHTGSNPGSVHSPPLAVLGSGASCRSTPGLAVLLKLLLFVFHPWNELLKFQH